MKKTDKWQWWFEPFGRNYQRFNDLGWHYFDAGIIKFKTMPEQGSMVAHSDYSGFIIRFYWWFPIDSTR